uniref:Uncharacterized protein n=1 Tax=Desulfomonile tiedjei TaxID=2358 RepID=A0A7C4AQP0_9BACT
MDNITNVLYSLLPLIIIIFLSWLFSQMGAKAKRRADTAQKEAPSLPGDQIMDILLGKGAATKDQAPQATESPAGSSSMTVESWDIQRPASRPEPTPKPITPKWWGA